MRVPSIRWLLHSNLLLGAAALGAGLLAAWFGARQINLKSTSLESEARQRYAPAPYVVASQDVRKGQRIDASVLSIRSMPRTYAPTDALTPADAGLLIGGRAAIGIRRGTPVVQAALMPDLRHERLSERVPPGMRALSIQVDQLNSLSGHLAAGDIVDLFYSRNQGRGAVLAPLLQRVRVLATGDRIEDQAQPTADDRSDGDFSSVTLLLAAADARRVVLAEQTGRLTLLLRRPADDGLVESRIFSSSELLIPARTTARLERIDPLPVELLVGGNGAFPARSWLSPGEGVVVSRGEGS